MTLLFIIPDSPVIQWVVLPLLIFCARICDQSIGTMRMIFISKGYKIIAPILGFFEVIIWLLAIGQIMKHLDNVMCYVAYGGGFAMGNFIGISIEERLSIGTVIIRIILKKEDHELISFLDEQGFGLTVVDAEGSRGKVKVLFSIIKRKDVRHFISIIDRFDPATFYTIEDVKSSNEGVFRPIRKKSFIRSLASGVMKSK